jgi:oligoribonuclease NrnB/cAMP/cGMP phosphodiesterase (DHH superfamily)
MPQIQNKPKPRVMFTHIDLDGVTCAIIFQKCYPGSHIYFTNYKAGLDYEEINKAILTVVPDLPEDVNILISDISPNMEVAEYLNHRGRIGLIDHHKTALPLSKYTWANVTTGKSGAMLVYEMLAQRFNIQDYYPLVELTNTYDMWNESDPKFPQAEKLSRLLGLIGRERFYYRFLLNSSVELTEKEEYLLEIDTYQMTKYINRSLQLTDLMYDKYGHILARVVADRYISQLGNTLLNHILGDEVEYVLITDLRELTCHLRGRGNVDLGQLAKEYGGGGHPKAAGFPIGDGSCLNDLMPPMEGKEDEGQKKRTKEES